jgi:hypothetical protein
VAWEWLAHVTTGAVAVAGAGFTYLASRASVRGQVKIARRQLAHERRVQTRQERRDAFADFLQAVDVLNRAQVERAGMWVTARSRASDLASPDSQKRADAEQAQEAASKARAPVRDAVLSVFEKGTVLRLVGSRATR